MNNSSRSSGSTATHCYFYLNNKNLTCVRSSSNSSVWNYESNSFSIYLTKGDKIYFESTTSFAVTERKLEIYCNPMF